MATSFAAHPSTNDSPLSKNIIEFKNSVYESYGRGNEKLVLRSKEGSMDLDSQVISLIGDVEGIFNLNGKTFKLRTNGLRGNLLDKTISSKQSSLFETEDIVIVSSDMEITQTPLAGIKILFNNVNLDKINLGSRISKGKANEVDLFLAKDLIVMKGNAEFNEDNMKIMSDEIHYDLNQDRVLKSVNSKIINNL
tara:strand:+ start:335 stop:916 length:582 start_codon:yes stop_codon:yes gene_type:complete